MRARQGLPALAPTLILLGLGSCSAVGSQQSVNLSTEPPGARVLVDERDSGFVTPCVLGLDADESYRIDFELPGYAPATRYLADDELSEVVFWREMSASYNTWNFPLWLNFRDFFHPWQTVSSHSPSRVFVRMYRTADG